MMDSTSRSAECMKVAELKLLLSKNRLRLKGKKADLVAR